jgi:hypothetical protein
MLFDPVFCLLYTFFTTRTNKRAVFLQFLLFGSIKMGIMEVKTMEKTDLSFPDASSGLPDIFLAGLAVHKHHCSGV